MHCFIKVAHLGKVRNLIGSIIANDPLNHLELASLFQRVGAAAGLVIKVTSSEVEKMLRLMSNQFDTESGSAKPTAFFLICLLSAKYNQMNVNADRADYYVYFNRAEKIRAIKCFRALVKQPFFQSVYGSINDGLKFAKDMIESDVCIGPCTKEFAYMVLATIQSEAPTTPGEIDNKLRHGYRTIQDAIDHVESFNMSRFR